MITKFESLKQIASQFENNRSPRDTFAIAVCHVGFNLDCESYPPHRPLVMAINGFQRPAAAADRSGYRHQYALDTHGAPLGITEYSTDLADGSNTHVILMHDHDSVMSTLLNNEHLDQDSKFHDLVL